MAPAKPMLDGVELPQAQRIAAQDEEALAQHGVPALEGDFLQALGRRATRLTLTGVLTGPEAGEGLQGLRDKFHAAEPVPFVSDIATATRVERVLIEEIGVRELAGRPERFEYALSLREYTPPPAVTEEPPPEIPPPPVPETATLVVEVTVEGEPEFDFSRVRVTAAGNDEEGGAVSRTLANRNGNVWTEEDFPPGSYTVEAVVDAPDAMTGSTPAEVREGETTQVAITLRRGAAVAKAFFIHFWFDKAFIEPCLREVLQRAAAYSDAHPEEKVLIVGHTDLVGSDDYNQSLSERRGRSVHAYLTSGRDRAAAVAEWNELRKSNPGGVTIRDSWSTREYQYILQDLGYYKGNLDEDHGPATDAAVRAFQGDHGLTPDGIVGDATWEKLVEAYLDEDPLSIPEERFFRNARGGCDGGVVKWLGCGEQDPVRNTQDAWRPNRRTEVLFIRADAIPCEVPKPVTFDLPSPGAVGASWCLGPGNPAKRCCFTTRKEPQEGKWLVRPAEPGKVLVAGTITFEDGTPVSKAAYALIAPDGEYLHTGADGKPDTGERPAGPQRGRPIPNRAGADGSFRHPAETPEGVYILELLELTEPQVARATEDPAGSGRGNVVCFRVEAERPPDQDVEGFAPTAPPAPAAGKGGVVQSAPAPAAPVNPEITPADPVVVVRRPYTSPGRVPITLRTSARFRRTGTLSRAGKISAVRLFTARTGGTEITFNGTDNVFPGNRLSGGVQLFAESDTPGDTVGDYQLTLTLDPGPAGATPVGGPPATASVTAVRLTLDIFESRPASGANPQPQPLPQPPDPPPAAGTATDKWFGGRLMNVQDAANSQERVRLVVRQVEPFNFAGDLVLRQVRVSGTTVGAPANRVRLHDNETPTPGEAVHPNPFEINAGAVSLLGRELFVEGRTLSSAERDTGFQLGVKDVEADGDRVAVTVGVGASVSTAAALRAVVVRKPHTNPARQVINLQTSVAFNRSGTLERSGNTGAIQLFRAATGGTPLTFAGGDNVFTGTELSAGLQLFAEGVSASGGLDDYVLTLRLAAGSPPAGIPATVRLTSVELTLDVGLSRPAPGVAPPLLPEAQKGNPGRFVQAAHPNLAHERAMLITRPPNPRAFVCELVLTPLSPLVQLFTDEVPNAAQTPILTPHRLLSGLTLPNGIEDFVQTSAPSAAPRDTGFQLGIVGLEDDGDRVSMTGFGLALTTNVPPFDTPVRRVQIEGLLHPNRASFDLGDLFGTQAASLFRARADVPGVAGNQLQAQLISRRGDGSLIESHNIILTRTAGNRFASLPILAIPQAFPRGDVTFRAPQNIDIMRCRAGGTLRLELRGALTNNGGVQVPVRGRVLELCTLTIQGAAPNIAGNLTTGNRVMAQAGIEARILNQLTANNAALLDIQQTDCPLVIGGDNARDPEETTLFALGRAACASNLIAYFVRSNSLGLFGCSAYPVGQPGVTVADTATQYTFIHELGHVLHLPHNGAANNLMTGAGTNSLPANPANVNLLANQCQTMYASGFLVFRGG